MTSYFPLRDTWKFWLQSRPAVGWVFTKDSFVYEKKNALSLAMKWKDYMNLEYLTVWSSSPTASINYQALHCSNTISTSLPTFLPLQERPQFKMKRLRMKIFHYTEYIWQMHILVKNLHSNILCKSRWVKIMGSNATYLKQWEPIQ